MRPARAFGHEFLRLLAQIVAPVYVLDEQRRIVFLNQAAAAWLGVEPEQLIGRACRYQSGDADPLSALADALCPPPEVFQGHKACGTIVKPSPDGSSDPRHAEFIPLPGEADRCLGVLAIVRREPAPHDSHSLSALPPESHQLHQLLQKLRHESARQHQSDRLVGTSAAMARVREQIKLAAAGASAVLIVGPSGIGKRHVAGTIHAAAIPQSSQPGARVPISCGALPADQLRSTISTFLQRCRTSAETLSATLLLVDVDRLPTEIQSDLVHCLDGAPENLRIISTASDPLDDLANRDAFHSELAHRLSTLVIELPPLADRREDIPLLAQQLLENLNAGGGKQLRGFATDAMDRLVLYDWPGQIDELAAVVRQAFSQAEGFEITAADLPKQLRLAAEAARHPRPKTETIDLEKFLTRVELELIERALKQAKGNKSQAARLLGITRPRLYRRMVQLGLATGDDEQG
jgi:DNA-binding NtrC family response regulator